MNRADIVVAFMVMTVLIIAGIYDMIAVLSDGKLHTVTHAIADWSLKWPIIPFVAGLIIGHLFWK